MLDTFITDHTVPPSAPPGLSLQNPYCVRCTVDGLMVARQGAMVAYRGSLTIRTKEQGLRKLVKRAATGEGIALMDIEGQGDIWLADLAKNAFIMPGGGLSVAGKAVLCFEPSLEYEIRLVKGAGMNAGGLFNCSFTGDGAIALTAHGQPMVIPVSPGVPVLVDTDAVIGWTASLQTSIHRSEGIRSFIKGGSGEMFQLQLEGEGSVIVQPSEGPPPLPKGKGVADAIGDLIG